MAQTDLETQDYVQHHPGSSQGAGSSIWWSITGSWASATQEPPAW